MPNSTLIASLIELPRSLMEAKNQPSDEKLKEIRNKVKSSIPIILKEVDNSTLLAEKDITKILGKLEGTVDEFKGFDTDNASEYEELRKRINDRKSKRRISEVGSSSSHNAEEESPTGESAQLGESTVENIPQQDQFKNLSPEEQKCLICFCLFPERVEVKKRVLIHLWAAMELVDDDPVSGATMLTNLVRMGFITRTICSKRLCKRYKMNQNVRSMVIDEMSISVAGDDVTSLFVKDQQQPESPQGHQQQQQKPATLLRRLGSLAGKNNEAIGGLGTMVLNKSEKTFQNTTFEQISKMKNIKVLHLGSWSQGSDKYIVVEVEVLRGLIKHIKEVTFLSLEGVSGIVELPSSVYKLEYLRVLDLRGCPNLESLSDGIGSMKKLTHLDLSECYLLDHIPNGIASLTELRVLKGFIIINNPDDSAQVGNNGSKKEREISSSCASFCHLKGLVNLIKLSIRTRRINFPTNEDSDTLCAMKNLTNLKIAWVWNSIDVPIDSQCGKLPAGLKKLELQATPNNTMSQLLRVISNDTQSVLERLYIRGGRLWSLGSEVHQFRRVQTVRLRYLPDLRMDWDEFRKYFPKLTRLEVLDCPSLIFFPFEQNDACTEENMGLQVRFVELP